jgi:hypoxanthine phosphoribosyltransferase
MGAEDSFSGKIINNKVFLNWKNINDYTKQIHKYVLSIAFLPDAIVCIHKGGIIPSTILSYQMKIDELYSLKITANNVVYPRDIINLRGKNILIVDNILEDGQKIAYLESFLQSLAVRQVVVTTLVRKQFDTPFVVPDFSAKSISKEDWVIFPWEELNY